MLPRNRKGFRPANGHLANGHSANGVSEMLAIFQNGTPSPNGTPHGIPERQAGIIEEMPEGRSQADTLIARYQEARAAMQEARAAMQEASLELWNLHIQELAERLYKKMASSDADDILQETAKRLLQALPNFKKGSFAHDDDLLAYLGTIALNATRNHFGKRARTQHLPDAEDASRATIDSAQREASDILEEQERSEEREETFDSISDTMKDLAGRLADWLGRNGGAEPSPRPPGAPPTEDRFLQALRDILSNIRLAFELREKIDKKQKCHCPGRGPGQGP